MFEQAIHVHINHKPQPFKKVTHDLTRVAEHSTGGKSQMFRCCRSHELDQRGWLWGSSWKVGQLSILSVHRQKKAAAWKSHCLSHLLTATCEVTGPYWRLRQVYLDGIQREIVVKSEDATCQVTGERVAQSQEIIAMTTFKPRGQHSWDRQWLLSLHFIHPSPGWF